MSIGKLRELADEMAAQKAKLQEFAKENGRATIGAAFAPCFEPPTNLKSIRWTQYTPHFNDGDACTFGVNEPTLMTEIDGAEHEHDFFWLRAKDDNKYTAAARSEIGEKSIGALNSVWPIPEEILEAVFGDHVEVTITKDEVTVEEYEHD